MSSIKVYIPTDRQPSDFWVQETLSVMSMNFGGATATHGQGAWFSDTQGLIIEPVTICESFAADTLLTTSLPAIAQLCTKMKLELRQEAVAYAITPGTITFV
jgi:hypothetical protein